MRVCLFVCVCVCVCVCVTHKYTLTFGGTFFLYAELHWLSDLVNIARQKRVLSLSAVMVCLCLVFLVGCPSLDLLTLHVKSGRGGLSDSLCSSD